MRKYHFSEPSDNKQSQNIIQMPLSHFAGKNFWIFKATSLNRGRGIHVFNTLEQLYELIKQYSGSATGKKILFRLYFRFQTKPQFNVSNFIKS